jgi:hypothetical protein
VPCARCSVRRFLRRQVSALPSLSVSNRHAIVDAARGDRFKPIDFLRIFVRGDHVDRRQAKASDGASAGQCTLRMQSRAAGCLQIDYFMFVKMLDLDKLYAIGACEGEPFA